ncbi:MAG: LamG domain-containing protein, partial [Planctomycetota bacterium]
QEKIDGRDVGFEIDPQLFKAGGGGTIGDVQKLGSLKAYQLKESSPVIDGGLDIKGLFGIDAGKHDYYGTEIPCGEKIDVGAHEFCKKAVKRSPVGWWKFDEGRGTVAKNSGSACCSGDGVLNNMDDGDWVSGIAGKCLWFNGSDDDVAVPALNLNSNSVTISGWVKREGKQSAYAGIVYSRDGDTIAGIGCGSSGEPDWEANQELYYSWNDAEDTWQFHSGLIIPDGKWAFVAVVVEPTKATLYMCCDGKLTSATNDVNHCIEEFNGVTHIGNDKKPDFPSRYFKGLIDDVRVYDSALSAEEVMGLAKSPD